MNRFLRRPSGKALVISVPYLWMFLFFLLPFVIVLKISFSQAAIAIPPYERLFQYADQALTIDRPFALLTVDADTGWAITYAIINDPTR